MAIIHGEHIIISVEGSPIAFLRSCDITSSISMKELRYPSATNAQEYTTSRASWSMSYGTLMGNIDFLTIIKWIKEKKKIYVRFATTSKAGEQFYFHGYAYIKSLAVNAPHRKLSTISVSLQGTGALTLYTPPTTT